MRVWPARLGDACSGCSTEVNLTDLVGVPGDEAVADPPGEEACSPNDAVAMPLPDSGSLAQIRGKSRIALDLRPAAYAPRAAPLAPSTSDAPPPTLGTVQVFSTFRFFRQMVFQLLAVSCQALYVSPAPCPARFPVSAARDPRFVLALPRPS